MTQFARMTGSTALAVEVNALRQERDSLRRALEQLRVRFRTNAELAFYSTSIDVAAMWGRLSDDVGDFLAKGVPIP